MLQLRFCETTYSQHCRDDARGHSECSSGYYHDNRYYCDQLHFNARLFTVRRENQGFSGEIRDVVTCRICLTGLSATGSKHNGTVDLV